MSAAASDTPPTKAKMAAILAAVQAYLEEEAQPVSAAPVRSARAWRMAAWQPTVDVQFRHLPWKGRD